MMYDPYNELEPYRGGIDYASGPSRSVVTMDADLQNPPEEIAKLLAAMDEGHDYVGGVRRARADSLWRRWASRAMNRLIVYSTGPRASPAWWR